MHRNFRLIYTDNYGDTLCERTAKALT